MSRVRYLYYRFYTPGEDWEDSIEDAVERAKWDVDDNLAYPYEIRSESGDLLMNHDQMMEAARTLAPDDGF